MTDDEPKERPLSFLGAAGWTLLSALLFQVAVLVSESARPGASVDLMTVTAARIWGMSLTLFAVLRVHTPEASIRAVTGLKWPGLLPLVLAAVLGLSLVPLSTLLDGLVAARFPPSREEAEVIERLLRADSPFRSVGLVVSLGLVLPVVDELFFRGVLFSMLAERARIGTVIFATAAYDVLLVGSPRNVASMAVLVLALSWTRSRVVGSLPSVVGRVTFFSAQVAFLGLGKSEPTFSVWWVVGASLVGGLTALLMHKVLRTTDLPEQEPDVA